MRKILQKIINGEPITKGQKALAIEYIQNYCTIGVQMELIPEITSPFESRPRTLNKPITPHQLECHKALSKPFTTYPKKPQIFYNGDTPPW